MPVNPTRYTINAWTEAQLPSLTPRSQIPAKKNVSLNDGKVRLFAGNCEDDAKLKNAYGMQRSEGKKIFRNQKDAHDQMAWLSKTLQFPVLEV